MSKTYDFLTPADLYSCLPDCHLKTRVSPADVERVFETYARQVAASEFKHFKPVSPAEIDWYRCQSTESLVIGQLARDTGTMEGAIEFMRGCKTIADLKTLRS